ncbi:hypothetical protein HELRODRAFT_162664 [Helobdella robusta]|uniref:F-box domain-containing protein n=1 Tax=Helobdella robusta TaxID=6412 RepID=T1ESZ4_HELRO|nr:hypothetical protein HELRODRAFT_162664 [Helobdella robusta]ESN99169.1 hypothetical protein HELRODRAFT_162664 [Helobdella robusta]
MYKSQVISINDVPQNVLGIIFSHLDHGDRFRASLVNKNWCYVFKNSSNLWKSFHFKFLTKRKLPNMRCLRAIGKFICNLYIEVNPEMKACRQSALYAINYFARQTKRRIVAFKLHFKDQCHFYNEFNEAINNLLTLPVESGISCRSLVEVELIGRYYGFDEKLIIVLVENHNKTLKKLYLHNLFFADDINADMSKFVISNCHQLTHLGLPGFSINDEVVSAITQPEDRLKLQKFVILCSFNQMYIARTSSKAWRRLVTHSKDLKVSLIFDYACPMRVAMKVFRPEIPVSELTLETWAKKVHHFIKLALKYYRSSLTKLSITCPEQHDELFEKELINVAQCCFRLSSLHIRSPISENTISKISSLRPDLKDLKLYTQ